MKKIIVFIAFSLLTSAQAFAGNTVILSLSTTGKALWGDVTGATIANPGASPSVLIGKTSTGVGLGARTGAVGYAMTTQHKSGSRAFGTAYDATAVFYKDVTVGSLTDTGALITPTATDSSIYSGWTSM